MPARMFFGAVGSIAEPDIDAPPGDEIGPAVGYHARCLGLSLRQPGKPDTKRAVCLASVTVPLLCLSGPRDEPAGTDLLKVVCEGLGDRATPHSPDTADHGDKLLKRTRVCDEGVFAEMARVAREWAAGPAR